MSYSFYNSLTKVSDKHNLLLPKLSIVMVLSLFLIPFHALNALDCIQCIHHYGKHIGMHKQYNNRL